MFGETIGCRLFTINTNNTGGQKEGCIETLKRALYMKQNACNMNAKYALRLHV